MTIYLPIAELPVAIFTIFAMGLAVGFISGMFGVGGGFLMTPLLIFTGVPPSVAVASVSPYMAASSFSGALSYLRKGMVDLTLSGVLLAGGLVGTAAGVALFAFLRRMGQVDLAIALSYTALLGAVLGVGGGFILVPALIYMLRVPTQTSVGTSLVLTLVTMTAATVLHAEANGTVDAVLALVLMIGGTVGAQFGARAGQTMRPEYLRLLLGLLVLSVGIRVAADLVRAPTDAYIVAPVEGPP